MQRNHFIVGGAIIVAIIIGVTVFLYSEATREGNPPVSPSPSVMVPFTELARGAQSNISTRTNYLITSSSEFAQLWKTIAATGTPPAVDFTKNSIAAVFAGPEPTAGYAITVTKIEDASARTVSITLAKPPASCKLKFATTTPYELIKMPITTLQLAHIDTVATTSCPQ